MKIQCYLLILYWLSISKKGLLALAILYEDEIFAEQMKKDISAGNSQQSKDSKATHPKNGYREILDADVRNGFTFNEIGGFNALDPNYQNDGVDHSHADADTAGLDADVDANYVVDQPDFEHYDHDHSGERNYYNDPPADQNHDPFAAYNRRQVPDKLMETDEIITKQGRIRGIVRRMHPQSGLDDVDQFLGIPYAEAPVGSKRFMPPGAPPPWHGIKHASHLPSVCPQNLPNLTKQHHNLSKGRYDQLVRLMPYLKAENEDCLYLNLYVPKWNGNGPVSKYPVIVYIHGESYEWNSGNPYDGSVLASYGKVIVVTLNYRLGILGFMKPGISEHTVSNFGLLDQIAALQWVKDNIELFGGDNQLVTVMGHGTGAACVNLLMVSPVAKGLFHRAILMSGSAMSDWATTNHTLQLTMQIAHGLNCPLNDANDEMLNCLRKKRYQEILKIPTSSPKFSTSFGPIVDGLVIPNQPYKVMGQYTDLFSRYDLLFGVTEVESYHTLNALGLEEGLRENERDNLLRFYMQNRFEIRPDLALAATLKKYTDIYNNPVKASSHEHRDVVLDILSDARVVAPVIQTGIFHAKVNPRTYMYVFGHNSEAGAYSTLPHSIVGEELVFVFGAPLAPAGPFHLRYSTSERLLSEAVMLYWSNFAKTGNPKAPWKDSFINLHPLEWERYDIDWSEFNTRNQCYVNIGIPPSIGFKYRDIYMQYWNKELPDELNQISAIQPPPFVHFYPPNPVQNPRQGTSVDHIITGHMNRFPSKNAPSTEDPLRTLKFLLKDPLDTAGMYNAQPTNGGSTDETKINLFQHNKEEEEDEVLKSESTVHILIGLVVVFLVVNAIILSMYLVKKRKKGNKITRKLGILTYDGTNDDDLKRTKRNDGDDSYVLDIIRKTNTYEAVKTSSHSPINGYKITRQLSSSTVDTHVKVNDWISQEISKYSPKSGKRSSPAFSVRARSFLMKPRKVNVAIDATPQARSGSILRQEPIEVTKLKSGDSPVRNIIVCQEVDVDAELLNPDENEDGMQTERRGSTFSIPEYPTVHKIDHKYSRSDPVEMYYTVHRNDEVVTSFVEDRDVNVTSCDPIYQKNPLSPEEQLQNIKRRNFPKVLPDYPEDESDYAMTTTMKRRSLPPQQLSFTGSLFNRIPPTPPPRTISTLGRYPSKRRQSNAITTSPLMLAEDCPEEEEPEITENTLIVGPLIPKSSESLYCTVRGKKPVSTEKLEAKPSGIKPPSTVSSFGTIRSSSKTNIPRTHNDSHSRIPQLKAYPTPTVPSHAAERDKSTPESISSTSDTNSSTGTVKTELKSSELKKL